MIIFDLYDWSAFVIMLVLAFWFGYSMRVFQVICEQDKLRAEMINELKKKENQK